MAHQSGLPNAGIVRSGIFGARKASTDNLGQQSVTASMSIKVDIFRGCGFAVVLLGFETVFVCLINFFCCQGECGRAKADCAQHQRSCCCSRQLSIGEKREREKNVFAFCFDVVC